MEFPYRWPKIHRFPWGLCHPYKFWGTGVSVKAGTHFRIVSDPPARFAKFSDAKLWGLWRWGKKKRFSWGDTQRWGEEVISRDSFGTYVIYIICMTCIYMISDFCRLSVVDFCWFMGCLRMVLFCFVFGGFWRFVKWILATQSEPSTGRQSLSHWLNSYVQRIDKPLWRLVPLMRLTAQPLFWVNLLENTQCDSMFSVGEKRPGCKISTSKWKHERFNKKYMGLFHLWYDTAVLPDFGRDFPFLSCRQVGGWLTNSTCESDATPSHPYRIASEWSGTWKSHHPTDSWDHCIFPHPSFYGRGGGCFTKIGTVLG